jgi:hypothetical protein
MKKRDKKRRNSKKVLKINKPSQILKTRMNSSSLQNLRNALTLTFTEMISDTATANSIAIQLGKRKSLMPMAVNGPFCSLRHSGSEV